MNNVRSCKFASKFVFINIILKIKHLSVFHNMLNSPEMTFFFAIHNFKLISIGIGIYEAALFIFQSQSIVIYIYFKE